MLSINNISYILLLLLINTIMNRQTDFYKLLRGIIILGTIFKIHQYYHKITHLRKIPIHDPNFENQFLKLKGSLIDKNKKIFKSLIRQLNKYNHWYNLTLHSRKKQPTVINQYYQNTLLYYNETINTAYSLLISNTDRDVDSDTSDSRSVTKLIHNLQSKMSSDIGNLKRLIVNNNISPNINKPANIGLVEPNDTIPTLYETNYSIF